MKHPKENDLAGRRKAATEAKAALLEAHRTARDVAEPTRLARQEERLAAAAAKEERQAERARQKLEEQELERARAAAAREQDADVAPAEAEVAKGTQVRPERTPKTPVDEAARKAERDRRYASRKARKK